MGSSVRLYMNTQKNWNIKMRVFVTGGAGYIGNHTCVELLEAGHEVFVIDNLCNGHEAALERVQDIANRDLQFTNFRYSCRKSIR